MTTGLVFGTFDGLHEGHRAFLREVKRHCDHIVASVPSDEYVRHHKGSEPQNDYAKRSRVLIDSGLVDDVVVSDAEEGAFTVIENVKPDVILLGYDQHDLEHAIMQWFAKHDTRIEIKKLSAHEPEVYKSSKLRNS